MGWRPGFAQPWTDRRRANARRRPPRAHPSPIVQSLILVSLLRSRADTYHPCNTSKLYDHSVPVTSLLVL